MPRTRDSIGNNESSLVRRTAAKQIREMRTFLEGWEEVPKPNSILLSVVGIHTYSPQSGSRTARASPGYNVVFTRTAESRNTCRCVLLRARSGCWFLWSQPVARCREQSGHSVRAGRSERVAAQQASGHPDASRGEMSLLLSRNPHIRLRWHSALQVSAG